MRNFVHLSGHSEYSTDGYSRIRELVAAAKGNGQSALALTDTNLSGALDFRDEARRLGIKPIIGLDIRLSDSGKVYDLTLLAENSTGWHSLVALYSEARANEVAVSHVMADHSLLARHADGVVALTGGRRGPVFAPLEANDVQSARTALSDLEAALGTGRVFLEATDPATAQLLAGVFPDRPVLATARYRQAVEADSEGRDALAQVRSGRDHTVGRDSWIKSDAEMRALGGSRAWQNAVSMASAVAAAISADAIPSPARQVPDAGVPDGFTDAGDYLRHLAFRGLITRYDVIPLAAIERLNLELDRIIDVTGAAEYILAARDILDWCRNNGILTAARGTSSGSMVLFCLGLTEINPLQYRLKFDRFMRAGRDALPSLAVDIQRSRREDVLDYLAGRWPGQVARASSAARAKASSAKSSFSRITTANADMVDGRVKYLTAHACAIVLGSAPLLGNVPLRPGHDLPVAAWEPQDLERQGFMVLNLLFSFALDVINRTAADVRISPEGDVRMGLLLPDGEGDLYGNDTDAAWDLIASGDTDGVFSLGGDTANAAAAEARPRSLTDMAVLIALSSKPLQLDAYLHARSLRASGWGRFELVTADGTEQMWLSGALSETCGQLVFQEQVIELLTRVGGFSNAQAELGWRTLAKKSPDAAYIRSQFMEGAVQEQRDRAGDLRSIAFSEETAERVFDLLVKATPNAFCGAHAYSYARVAFQSAFMRAHYPETFRRILDEVQPHRKRRTGA